MWPTRMGVSVDNLMISALPLATRSLKWMFLLQLKLMPSGGVEEVEKVITEDRSKAIADSVASALDQHLCKKSILVVGMLT